MWQFKLLLFSSYGTMVSPLKKMDGLIKELSGQIEKETKFNSETRQ